MNDTPSLEDGKNIFIMKKEKSKEIRGDEEESKNGLSPINMERIKTRFTGLSKEELLKFSNDPFWVRIRWFLFIGFWVMWSLMLFSAIFIIVTSPKCAEPPVRVWWQRSPIYEIDVKNLRNVEVENTNKTITDFLKLKLDYLKLLNVETVLLKSALLSSGTEGDEIIDYKNVNDSLGTVDTLKELAEYAKSKGIHLLLSLIPNHSSDKNIMFARSVLQEDVYKDFYVWANSHDSNDHSKPPNNWLSMFGGSAWEWSKERKQFYLHQFKKTQPDFNFRFEAVVDYFADVMNFWMDQGFSGFHLENTEYLVEDTITMLDEAIPHNVGFVHDEYGFYSHKRTKDLPESTAVLKQWSKIIANRSGILSVSGGAGERNQLINFVLQPIVLSPNFSANQLNTAIKQWMDHVHWPTWKWACSSKDEEECFPEFMLDGLQIVSFLLPGTPVTYLGQELGFPPNYPISYYNKYNIHDSSSELHKRMNKMVSSDKQEKDSESYYSIYKALNNLRNTDTIMFGNYSTTVLNETIFILTRYKSGSPGYLALWNIDKRDKFVNVTTIESVPNELTVVVRSGYGSDYPIKSKVSSSSIHIPEKAAIVFSFVPI